MLSTIAADRLEFVLVEMRDAIVEIEKREAHSSETQDALNNVLLEALRKARNILEEAQIVAEENGVPRLAVFA